MDHRSLAAQREEALQKGDPQKAAELDRAPQVKLGWKVVQMERRQVLSDRGDQLRAVKAANIQRQTVVLDIGQSADANYLEANRLWPGAIINHLVAAGHRLSAHASNPNRAWLRNT